MKVGEHTAWGDSGAMEVPVSDPGLIDNMRLEARVGVLQVKELFRDARDMTRVLIPTFGALALAATAASVHHSESETTLGAHTVAVSPSFDGFISAEWPTVVTARVRSDGPLGLGAHLRVVDTPDIETAIQRDALISANPKGEISSIKREVTEQLIHSTETGTAIALYATAGLFLYRRKLGKETPRFSSPTTWLAVGAVGAALALPGNLHGETPEGEWIQLTSVIPETANLDVPELAAIELQHTDTSTGIARLARSYIDTYRNATKYYDNIYEKIPLIAPQLRQPLEGEVVVLQVTDRHDNILMDRVARAIGDAGGATIVITTGDDTATGSEWEAFSLNSLDANFKGYTKIAVPGNHDPGDFVADYLSELGWEVLNGEVKTIGGINWLGDDDPRISGLGNWRVNDDGTVADQAAALAEVACSYEDGPVTMAVHDADAASIALEQGCANSAMAGHLHIQVGPEEVFGANGEVGSTFTNASTGGASYAFALGNKLRRDAQVSLHTYKDGRLVGIQPVTITIAGELRVDPFWVAPQPISQQIDDTANKPTGGKPLRANR